MRGTSINYLCLGGLVSVMIHTFVRFCICLSLIFSPLGSSARTEAKRKSKSRGPASISNVQKQLSLEGISNKDRIELLRTLRTLAVKLERAQNAKMDGKRSNTKKNSSISLRFFSAALAEDANAGNESQGQEKNQKVIKALQDLRRAQLALERAKKPPFGQDINALTRDFNEAKLRLQNLANGLEIESLAIRDILLARLQDEVARTPTAKSSISARGPAPDPAATPTAATPVEPAAPAAAPTPSPLINKTCNFAGASSTIQQNGNRLSCVRPESLKGNCGENETMCGPLFTELTMSDTPKDKCLPIGKNLSERCATAFAPLSETELTALPEDKRQAFNDNILFQIAQIEQQVYETCPATGRALPTTSQNECQALVQRYAQAAQVLRQNEDNKKLVDVRKDVYDKWVEQPSRAGLAGVGENSDYQNMQAELPRTTPNPLDTSVASSPDSAAAAADTSSAPDATTAAETTVPEPTPSEKLLANSACPSEFQNPQRLDAMQGWSYQCIADCKGKLLMLVTKKNASRIPPTESTLEQETYLINISPEGLKQLAKGEPPQQRRGPQNRTRGANQTPEELFRSSLRAQSLFGCEISKSPKNRNAINTLAQSIRNIVTCEDSQLYVKNNSVTASNNDRDNFLALQSDNSRFGSIVPKHKSAPQTLAIQKCGISHNLRYNPNMGKNSDTIEWKIEDTQATFPSRGAGKDLMKCTTKANIPDSRIGKATEGAIILSSISRAVSGNEYLECMNAQEGAYPNTSVAPLAVPAAAPSSVEPEPVDPGIQESVY